MSAHTCVASAYVGTGHHLKATRVACIYLFDERAVSSVMILLVFCDSGQCIRVYQQHPRWVRAYTCVHVYLALAKSEKDGV